MRSNVATFNILRSSALTFGVLSLGALTLGMGTQPAAQAQAPAPAPQPAGMSTQDSTNDLTVAVGKSVIVDCAKPVTRVSVGVGDFAEANAVSPTEIVVNGKTPGDTSLIIWEAGGTRQFFNINVLPAALISGDHMEALRRELRAELPGQSVKVSTENGSIFLRGTVKDLISSDRAVLIASTAGKPVNLLNVEIPKADQQILLKVRFAAVDRSRSRQLGFNLFSTGLGNTIGAATTGQFSPPSVGLPSATTGATATLSNELNLFAYYPGLNLGATIEAMESKGLVEVLAEPNVLAENGKQASFLAGGEYPFPIVQGTSGGSNSITIQFKEYGVRLTFVPTITPRGTIRLQVAPEVSSLDFTNAIEISGFQVPAIDTRKVKTEIELGDGQSFAIGGLLDNRETQTFQKVPFLGDIPILGKFFQSISKTKNNTELIVIVTPVIVDPIPAGGTLPTLKFPEKFLPTNSGIPMNTPDTRDAAKAEAAKPSTIPVEQLLKSMQPGKQLTPDTSTGASGFAQGASGASAQQ